MRPYNRRAKPTQRWVVSFNRLPLPPVEYNSRYVAANNNQQLIITVVANTQDEAIAKAWAQINYQIKGGRYITTNAPPINNHFPRVGSPRIYGFAAIKKIGRF
jgi:hypothetical protein